MHDDIQRLKTAKQHSRSTVMRKQPTGIENIVKGSELTINLSIVTNESSDY